MVKRLVFSTACSLLSHRHQSLESELWVLGDRTYNTQDQKHYLQPLLDSLFDVEEKHLLETVETNSGKTKMLQRGSFFGATIRKQTSLYLMGGIKNNLVVLKVAKVFFAEVVK